MWKYKTNDTIRLFLSDLALAFRKFDANADHKLSSDEIGDMLGLEVLNALINSKADSDEDGYFSEEELQAALLAG